MSGKDKKNFKKFSKRLLASFRKGKKLSQVKEHSNVEDGQTGQCSSSMKGLQESNSDNTVLYSAEDEIKEDGISEQDECSSVEPVMNADVPSTSNGPNGKEQTPKISRHILSGVSRYELGGVMSASADSGIDCNTLLMDKGSPELFQSFSRRESERLRHEYLQSRREGGHESGNRHTLKGITEAEGELSVTGEADGANLSANGSLLEQINQTREQINLLSELKVVLAKKLESCRLDSGVNVSEHSADSLDPNLQGALSNSLQTDNIPNDTNSNAENFLLNSVANKTDEAKSAEARTRRENESVWSQGNLLQIESPHRIVSPIPIMSTSLANNKTLPSTPSPARTFLNENGAFAKCKSIRRSVSDVGKGLLGKLKHKRKGSDTTAISGDAETGMRSEMSNDNDCQIGDHSFTIVDASLCSFGDADDPRDSFDEVEIDTSFRESAISHKTAETAKKRSPILKDILSEVEMPSIPKNGERNSGLNTNKSVIKEIIGKDEQIPSCHANSATLEESIHELTAGICEMTSALQSYQGSSAESIACICDCKKEKSVHECCDKGRPPLLPFVPDNLHLDTEQKQKTYQDGAPSLSLQKCNEENVGMAFSGGESVKVQYARNDIKEVTMLVGSIDDTNSSLDCRPDSYGEESLAEILSPDRGDPDLEKLQQQLHKNTTRLTEQELWEKGMICDLTAPYSDIDSSSNSDSKVKCDDKNEGSDYDNSDCSGDCSDLDCSCCCQDLLYEGVTRKGSSSSSSSESTSSTDVNDQAEVEEGISEEGNGINDEIRNSKGNTDSDKVKDMVENVCLQDNSKSQENVSKTTECKNLTLEDQSESSTVKVSPDLEQATEATCDDVFKQPSPYTVSFKELLLGNGDVICIDSSFMDNASCNETSYGEAMSSPCLLKFGPFTLTPNSSPAGSGIASIDISPSLMNKGQDLNIANFSVQCSPTPLNLSRESSLAEVSVDMSPTPLNLSQNSSIINVSVDNNSPRQVEGSEGECSVHELGASARAPLQKRRSSCAQVSTDSSPTPPNLSESSSVYNVSDNSSPSSSNPQVSSSAAVISEDMSPKPLDLTNSRVTDTSFTICRRKDSYIEYKMARQAEEHHADNTPTIDLLNRTLSPKENSPDINVGNASQLKRNEPVQSCNTSPNTLRKADPPVPKSQSNTASSGRNLSKSASRNTSLSELSSSTPPLDLSMSKKASIRNKPSVKSAAWVEGHVGQVFSPAQRVLHKNRGLSETDLCRQILDLYVSDAEESGFDDSINITMSPGRLERVSRHEDSLLQYGTYVAPRNIVKETNVDDFTTTTKKTCYTGEAKTRKLHGGSAKGLLGGEDRRRAAEEEFRQMSDGDTSQMRYMLNTSGAGQVFDCDSSRMREALSTSMSRKPAELNLSMTKHILNTSRSRKAVDLETSRIKDLNTSRLRQAGNTSWVRQAGNSNISRSRKGGDLNTSRSRQGGDLNRSFSRQGTDLDTSKLRQTADGDSSKSRQSADFDTFRSRQAVDVDTSSSSSVDLDTSLSRSVDLDTSLRRRRNRSAPEGHSSSLNTSLTVGGPESDSSWSEDGDLSFGEIIASAPADTARSQSRASRFVTFGGPTSPVQGRGALRDRTNTTRRSSALKQSKYRDEQKDDRKDQKAQSSSKKMGERSFDRLTQLHTAHNGRRKVRCLSMNESLHIVKHYPPPKEASRISWGQTLEELDLYRHSPRRTPVKTRPILTQKENDYPYDEHTPSPIVLTKMRKPKSQSKKFRNWPWS